MNLHKRQFCFSTKLALPKPYPILYWIPWLSCISGFFSHTYQLQSRNMQHLFNSTCVVTSFDDIQSNTVVDTEGRCCSFFEWELFTATERVFILKLLGIFLLHLYIFFIGSKRVSILFFRFLLSFLLPISKSTKLIGCRYYFTCLNCPSLIILSLSLAIFS